MKKNDKVGTKEETTTTIDKETKNFFLLHKKKKNVSVIKRSQRGLRKIAHDRFYAFFRNIRILIVTV